MRSWLVERRQQKGLSQRRLAQKVGISQPALCNIENGVHRPKPDTAIRIAKVLGIKWTRFFED